MRTLLAISSSLAMTALTAFAFHDGSPQGFDPLPAPPAIPLIQSECAACNAVRYYLGPPTVHAVTGDVVRNPRPVNGTWGGPPEYWQHDCPCHPNSFQK